jgi:hypothetical protein
LDKNGDRHEIAINVKNNRPQENETTEETDETATDDGTYTEEIPLGG